MNAFEFFTLVEPRQHLIEFIVAWRRRFFGRAVGPVVAFYAGSELPEGTCVDFAGGKSDDGAVGVEVGEEDGPVALRFLFFFDATSSPGTPTNAAISTVKAGR